jgi:hypothetical protein
VEGVGTLCSVESGVQTPSRTRSPSPCTDKVEKGNLEAPAAVPAHIFWGEGRHGASGQGQVLSKATIGHNMATTWPLHGLTRLQHSRNMQIGESVFWLFCSKFLAEASKKIELDV